MRALVRESKLVEDVVLRQIVSSVVRELAASYGSPTDGTEIRLLSRRRTVDGMVV